jgi:hypothetical protein
MSWFLFFWYLKFQDSVEATAEVSKTFNEKIKKYCDVTLMSLAYAGTGNVLKVLNFSSTLDVSYQLNYRNEELLSDYKGHVLAQFTSHQS